VQPQRSILKIDLFAGFGGGLSLARDIGVAPIRISQIVNGWRAITLDTAMRLARYFGTSAAVWLRLQVRYDLEVAEQELSEKINREVKVLSRTPSPM